MNRNPTLCAPYNRQVVIHPTSPGSRESLFRRVRLLVAFALALWAAWLSWAAVRWALQPGLFPIIDELGNPALFLCGSYHEYVHFFPGAFFGDRSVAWALVKLLADLFGFNYTHQVMCFLGIHFANCAMAFVLFRRLGASLTIAIAGFGLFGSLWTTAQTATYPGEPGDMLALFFLLASVLALLWERRGSMVLSALLYLAALRSKEFAIVLPVALTVLVALQLPRMPLWRTFTATAQRLWMHYAILVVFGLRYLSLYRAHQSGYTTGSPYHVDLHLATVLNSFSYYTGLIFGADASPWQIPPVLLAVVFVALLVWAVLRRRAGLAFGICAYVLTLLPVSLISNRAAYYVYAPQAFLILALCLLTEEVLTLSRKRERLQWGVAACVAVACLAWCVSLQHSQYFRDRVNWNVMVRHLSFLTAREAEAKLPRLGAGTHVYVSHNPDATPWLFITSCPYLQLLNQQRGIYCITDKPADEMRTLYNADRGPKLLLDYHDDGSIAVANTHE